MSVQRTTFAAGCFWGVEWVYRQVPGVLDAVSGYTGGITPNPTYREVCSHTTGHAEAVEVTFEDEAVSFDQLLEVFWAMHDPTQVDGQGPDFGDQYRSAIFVGSSEQRAAAEASKARAQERSSRPIATRIEDTSTFYPAEDYHQRYYEMNGHTPYCHKLPVGLLKELGLAKV